MKIRVRRHLEGWDFRDLAADNDPYKPHVATPQTIGNGWVDSTKAIRAITLFGRGFGEIIQPSNTIFCSRWRALPKHGYYLAVCVSDLKEIMLQHEGDVTAIPRKLTRDITWHSPDTAFEPYQGDPVEGPPQQIRIKTESQFHDGGIGSNQSFSIAAESEPATSITQQLSNDSPAGRMSPQAAPPSAAPAARDVFVSSPTALAIQSSQGSSIAAVNEDSATSSAPQLALGNPHLTLTRRKRVYDKTAATEGLK
ncbi:hypothetical protein VE03_02781 [Pseudogymnoascus sp. 23342-1-I1]|nr:hypothetical protein VE03_02781 [Pseudogymnoascus sp. 23342-1-I1]